MTFVRQLLDEKGSKIWSIDPDATVFDAVAKMAEKDIGSALWKFDLTDFLDSEIEITASAYLI